eukprot:gb/GEZN01001423.1/.p1 GENE.gb/GEZN01001423.1/~~gb/GEZN01001423.1/.p1  ORF type:complete len:884 (+),score=174.21 gb/GEZN01001423.1/:50-2701(+)
MFVLKRDGRKEPVHFDKITSRIKKLCYGLDANFVDPAMVSQKVCMGVYKGVTTVELDELAAETAAGLASDHPDYGLLAARIAVSNLHKETQKSFSGTCKLLYEFTQPKTGKKAPLLADNVYKFIQDNAAELDSAIVFSRDFKYDYFGFKTLQRSYLMKINGQIVERPQHMLMRVSAGIHTGDLAKTIKTYNLMSEFWFTHASPTLFNAGSPLPQLSSCFLVTMAADSIEGIYDTLKQCALISKQAGGIGLAVHNVRAFGSYISGTNGTSNGLVPMLRVFNNTARYVDQGGGKRKGAFAIYLEPWHADIFEWLDLRKNTGVEEARARDLFYGLWIPDLFMERVEKDSTWSLFCPKECPGLPDVWGEEFNKLYSKYEESGHARRIIKARTLWQAVLEAQIETGNPYMLYKDACNRKSNQQNLGTIRSSNLCTEIVEYTSADEIAVCNLASIALPMCANEKTRTYDHQRLFDVVYAVTENLNKIIDINHYPVVEAKNSNMRHRPIGIGVQGLADTFQMMHYPFESAAAKQLNKDIFETIYFAALTASCDLAVKDSSYSSFKGSPASKGILQFDMWGVKPDSNRWNWDALKARIVKEGLRNSLLVAPMPTASTSQILGNNECFEPFTSNIYVRRTLAGEFVCINKFLLRDLVERGLWNPKLKNRLIAANGSVQGLDLPADVKDLYKTTWEIKGKTLLEMAADRGAFIDQSQSLNVHMTDVNFGKLTSMHFYAWKKGLKTGMYYLRTQAATDAIKFTVDQAALEETAEEEEEELRSSQEPTVPKVGMKSPFKHRKSPNKHKLSPQRTVSLTVKASPNSPPGKRQKTEKEEDVGKTVTPLKFSSPELFSVAPVSEKVSSIDEWRAQRQKNSEAMVCALENGDECTSCGS